MLHLKEKHIDKTIPKIKVGLKKYLWLQVEIKRRNVNKNKEFQRRFNYFYKITPFRNFRWQKEFYQLLENNKKGNVGFENILRKLYKKTGRVESSFASKLVATINPNMPVIDSNVLRNVREMGNPEIKLPNPGVKDRLSKIVELRKNLKKLYDDFLATSNGRYLVEQFTKKYPETKKERVTKTKMLDFVLWQFRKN